MEHVHQQQTKERNWDSSNSSGRQLDLLTQHEGAQGIHRKDDLVLVIDGTSEESSDEHGKSEDAEGIRGKINTDSSSIENKRINNQYWKDAAAHLGNFLLREKWTTEKSFEKMSGLALADFATTATLTGTSVAATMVAIGSLVDVLPKSELLELFTLDSMFQLQPGLPSAMFYSAAAITAASSAVKTVYQSSEKRRSAPFMNNKILKLATLALALTGTGLALRQDNESMIQSVAPASKRMFDVYQSDIINARLSFFNDFAPDPDLERAIPEQMASDLVANAAWMKQYGTLSFVRPVSKPSVILEVIQKAYDKAEQMPVYLKAIEKFAALTVEEQAAMAIHTESMTSVTNLLLKVENWLAASQSEDGWEKNMDIAELLVRDLFLKEKGYAQKLLNVYNTNPTEWLRAHSDNAFFLIASRLAYEDPLKIVYGTKFDPRVASVVNSLHATMDIVGNNYLTRRNWVVNFFQSKYFKEEMLPLLVEKQKQDNVENAVEIMGRHDTVTNMVANVAANSLSVLRSVNDALHTKSSQTVIAATVGTATAGVIALGSAAFNSLVYPILPTNTLAAAGGMAASALTSSALSPYVDKPYDLIDRLKVLPQEELLKQLEVMIHQNTLPIPLHETIARIGGLLHADDKVVKNSLKELNQQPHMDLSKIALSRFEDDDMKHNNEAVIDKIEARQYQLDVREEYKREAPVVTSLLSDIKSDMVLTKYGVNAQQYLTSYIQPELPPVLLYENKERLINEIDKVIQEIQNETETVKKHMKVYPVENETPSELSDFESNVRYVYSFVQSYQHDDTVLYNQLTKPAAAIAFLSELKHRVSAIEVYAPVPDKALSLLKSVYL